MLGADMRTPSSGPMRLLRGEIQMIRRHPYSNLLNIPLSVFGLGFLILYFAGFAFFIDQILHPPCCDANQYLDLAERINTQGLAEVKESLRTFGYPWVLSLIVKAAKLLNLPSGFLIFLVQISAYFIVVVFITNHLGKESKKLAGSVYIALCANIFLLPYLGISLTDSLYTSIALALLVILMKKNIFDERSAKIQFGKVLFVTFLLSMVITIRPAGIWLAVPIGYLLFSLWLFQKNKWTFLIAVLLGTFPIQIQVVLNTINFNAVTFLPVADLGNAQIKWGIENFKYATWLGAGKAQNFYPSFPIIDSSSSELGLKWYLANPANAFKLLLIKVFAAFDWDYIMPYPRTQSTYKWIGSFFSFTILWVGLFGTLLHACTNKLIILGPRFMPFIVFISWSAITLSSALELRFTLPMLSYLIIAGFVVINHIAHHKNMRLMTCLVAGWIIFMPLALLIAKIVRSQATIQ
jgi:hypothetical protein